MCRSQTPCDGPVTGPVDRPGADDTGGTAHWCMGALKAYADHQMLLIPASVFSGVFSAVHQQHCGKVFCASAVPPSLTPPSLGGATPKLVTALLWSLDFGLGYHMSVGYCACALCPVCS